MSTLPKPEATYLSPVPIYATLIVNSPQERKILTLNSKKKKKDHINFEKKGYKKQGIFIHLPCLEECVLLMAL